MSSARVHRRRHRRRRDRPRGHARRDRLRRRDRPRPGLHGELAGPGVGIGLLPQHGRMMPVDGIDQLATGDAILLGAVGAPDIPDDVTLWGLLIPIRREFQQYVNLRPVRILPGVVSPLAGVDRLDLVVVRENVEGEYSEIGGRLYRGRPDEMAVQESVFTRAGIERVAEYADRARADSAAGPARLGHQVQRHHPHHAVLGRGRRGVRRRELRGDRGERPDRRAGRPARAQPAHDRRHRRVQPLRRHPLRPGGRRRRLDRRRPERQPEPAAAATRRCSNPSTGPRPTSPAEGIANPVGQIWAAAHDARAPRRARSPPALLVDGIEAALAEGIRTRDLGGTASTDEFTKAVLHELDHIEVAGGT